MVPKNNAQYDFLNCKKRKGHLWYSVYFWSLSPLKSSWVRVVFLEDRIQVRGAIPPPPYGDCIFMNPITSTKTTDFLTRKSSCWKALGLSLPKEGFGIKKSYRYKDNMISREGARMGTPLFCLFCSLSLSTPSSATLFLSCLNRGLQRCTKANLTVHLQLHTDTYEDNLAGMRWRMLTYDCTGLYRYVH